MARRARAMALVGIVIGLGAASALLWNEWRLARELGALGEAEQSLAVEDGEAVYRVGEATAAGPAHDPDFGISVQALRLDRTAETYQWREHREGSGDNKILRYERVWSPVLIPSQRFEQRSTHVNPARLRVESARFPGGEAPLAGLILDPALVDRLPATRELFPDRAGPVAASGLGFRRAGDWLYSGDPEQPRTGDVRVRFAAAPEGRVSVIASETEGRLAPWRARRGGGEVALAAYGEVPAEELVGSAARRGWRDAWALRGFAGLGLTLGVFFASPALAQRSGGEPAFRGGRRLGTILLLGIGLSAAVCALGWLGARLLLGLGAAGGLVPP
jgi:hypothetical protein